MMMTLRTLLNVGFMMFMLMVIFKARDHSSITGKYTASANRDCNIKVKLCKNWANSILKINVVPKVLEKHTNFNINSKLIFIDSLSSSLDKLVKKLGQSDFKYLCQEFHSKVLDLVKQKGFYPYENMSGFKKFK